jgi:ankyrin repeat protein
MSYNKVPFIGILLIYAMLCLPVRAFSQTINGNQLPYDTSGYIPSFYEGANDYNLMIAASKGYFMEIDRLISKGANINSETAEGVTPLVLAVANNQEMIVHLLIKYGADVNKITTSYETPLIIAVKNQNEEISESLIRAGAEIDFTDRYNATPLHYASIYGYFKTVDMLLYYEAAIDKKTVEGTTPLAASIWAGNADIADLLIQHGANMESRDNEGFTPFLMASVNGDTLLMDLLYKKGVDIYAVNSLKHNALTLSILADYKDAAAYLLRIGDKWTSSTKDVINPYHVAAKYRRNDIISLLKNQKIAGGIKYEIDQVSLMASSRFSFHDMYAGASLSFKEPYLNGGIIAGCDTKILYSRVLIKTAEHQFYQYMDKGSVVYAGLFKDFALTDYAYKGNFELSASLSAGYAFGNKLKGTLITPENKFCVIPAASVKWTKKIISLSLGMSYLKTEFYHVGPVWFRFGASYNLFFDNVRAKAKTMKWF